MVFRTPEWCLGWIRHIYPDAEPHIVVARDTSGQIAGIAPFCCRKFDDLGFRLPALTWTGREVVSGDFLDILAKPEMRSQVLTAILEFIWQSRNNWGLLVAGELTEDGDTLKMLESISQARGNTTRRQEERICPYICLPATFDQYLLSVSTSTRYHIRRRMRNATKKGRRRHRVLG